MNAAPQEDLAFLSSNKQNLLFLHVTAEDQKILREIGAYLSPKMPEVIAKFYDSLLSFDIYQQYLSNPNLVERLKKAQLEYFQNLFDAAFDEAYAAKRRQIGMTHERIGLEPRWYIGSYYVYCRLIFPLLREKYGCDPEKLEEMLITLLKAFNLDIQIAMESYIKRYSSELVDASKSLEQKLWMEDRLLSFILTEAGDAIVGLDEQDRISTWSQGAQRIFGYKISEILDKSLSDLLQQPEIIEQLKKNAEEEGSATIYESEWRNKKGRTILADATLTLLRDKNGVQVGSTLIVRDTTEIRRLANKVKNMEQLSAMTKITAGVAHEIRTPLGVLALTGDLLYDRAMKTLDTVNESNREAIKSEISELISGLQREVVRLNEIVDHYLVLSRIKQPNKMRIHLKSYLEKILNDLSSRRPEKDILFYLNVHDEEAYVHIDAEQFQRVFLNLFENSQYSMKKKGIITIVAKKKKDHIEIAFHDTGIGIPAHQINRLFSAFYTNKPGGTGLGLYLVREIVEAHGGAVDIESVEGKGATVIIRLPQGDEES